MLTAPKTRLSVVGRAECLDVTGQPGRLLKPVSLSYHRRRREFLRHCVGVARDRVGVAPGMSGCS